MRTTHRRIVAVELHAAPPDSTPPEDAEAAPPCDVPDALPRRRSPWWVFSLGLAVGLLAGVWGPLLWLPAHSPSNADKREHSQPVADPLEAALQQWAGRLADELELTADQRRALEEEVRFTLVAAHDVDAEFQRQSGLLAEDLVRRLGRRLPPAQEARLRAHVASTGGPGFTPNAAGARSSESPSPASSPAPP